MLQIFFQTIFASFSFHPGLFIETLSFSIFNYWSFCIYSDGFIFYRFAIQNNISPRHLSTTFAQIHVQVNPDFDFLIDDYKIGLWMSHDHKNFVDIYEERPHRYNQGTSPIKADTMDTMDTGLSKTRYGKAL